MSLSEFIRIAFLKTQFDQASWNLENSEIDFPTLLLNADETANSLRSIWDGDFVLTNKEYFCYYLGEYYQKKRRLLPDRVINSGLSKSSKKQDIDSITQILKVKALIVDDIVGLFKEIDETKWHASEKHNRSYLKKNHSENENERINLKIKSNVICYLTKCKEYDKLFQLLKAFKEDQKLLPKVEIGLIKLLLPIPTEKAKAVKMINEINFFRVSENVYFKLITFCSDFLSNEEIRELFPNKDVSEPELFEDVVDKEGMRYTLREEIIRLYDYLKPIWIFQPEMVRTLILKVSGFSSPAKEIYDSIFILSDLWNKIRIDNLNESQIISLLKGSIESLYIKRENEFRTRSQGLFDMDRNSTFIADSIKYLFKNIFHLSVQFLTKEKLEELIDYWINRDKSGDGFRHYSTGLVIANEINNSIHKNIAYLTYKVIIHAEENARLEQDTNSLTSYLGEVAESYGICGFKEDFQRIYNQLIEISFGVGYRKDYQAVDIIEPLELIHKIDPDNTLKRLSEVFHIQDRLNEVGNGRMKHICLSNLIAFAANKYPQLAFRLMELEEPNIARDEAINIIIHPLIENCSNDDLELYLAVIKTLPHWENGSHFIHLAKTFLLRAIYFNNSEVIGEILDIVKFNTLVELENTKELCEFSKILSEKGIDYTIYSLPDPKIINVDKTVNDIVEFQSAQKDKFIIRFEKLQFAELVQLFEDNYQEFEKHIQSQFNLYIQDRRNQLFRKEYHSAKLLFNVFYSETSPKNKHTLEEHKFKVIREYINLKNNIVYSDHLLNLREFEKFFKKFTLEVDNLLYNNIFTAYVDEKLNIEQWFEEILQNANWQKTIFFNQILSDKEVLCLVDQCSIMSINNILQFIEKWTQDRTRSASLLKIANRLITINPDKAKEILLASQYDFDSLLFQRNDDPEKLDFDIIGTILKVDKNFGKKFLLKSYIQKGRYTGHLTNSIDKLLKYQDYFDDESVKAYYESNLQYNKELALGLSDKENKYEFISQHSEALSFSEIIVTHLVWLFNYPAVKTRELALQATLDLIKNNTDYIKIFMHSGIEDGNDNEIEYSLVVLQAIALTSPTMLIEFKNELINLLKKEHFNILETTKELLLLISQSYSSFLTLDEISKLQSLNTASAIIIEDNNIKCTHKAKNFLYSSFQCKLIHELNQNEKDNLIFDNVYSEVVSNGWVDYDQEKEGAVHQRYNINTNFDSIEVQSPYYDQVKSSFNKVFHSKIKRNCFALSFVEKIRSKFRIYDPSKLLYSIVTRPSYINWIPEKISKDDFLCFSDFDSLVEEFIDREENYITLVDFGIQRVNRHKELNGTCYFEVIAFLKKQDFDLIKMNNLPFIKLENQYAYEMPLTEYDSYSFPYKEVIPLIQISYNSLRGEQDLVNTNLFLDSFLRLDIETKNLLDIFIIQEDYPLKAITWINSYASGPSRRRYKPSSEGFALKIKKNILLEYLQKNNLILCYNVKLRRSVDEYIPENQMNWRKLDKNVEMNLQ